MKETPQLRWAGAIAAVGAVWLFAGAVGVWIGMDIGRAIFG
jgi:hypothetical protein